MKLFRLASTLVMTCTLLLTSAASYAAPLVVSGNPQAPPIVWEKSGELTGIGPQLVGSFLDQEKIEYTIQQKGSWAEVQSKAKSGTVDIIVAAYDNEERREYLEYSIPYIKSPVVIVVKKGAVFPLNSWNDLAGKKGLANTGESFGEKFDTFIKEKLDVTTMSYERAFSMLWNDRADYLVIDLYPAVIYAKMLGAENKIEYLDNPVTIQNFHITIAKSSPYKSLIPKINAYIKQMQDKGEIKKMMKEQYQAWHKTFLERRRFFQKADMKAMDSQTKFNASDRDQGLDNLMRFVETSRPYMFN